MQDLFLRNGRVAKIDIILDESLYAAELDTKKYGSSHFVPFSEESIIRYIKIRITDTRPGK